MTLVNGSQRLGDLGDYAISDESDATIVAMIEERGLDVTTNSAPCAGDATFHAGWSLHSAPANPTADMREVMTVIYFADGMRVTEPVNESQKVDIDRRLPGLRPGELAASELNPLDYAKDA